MKSSVSSFAGFTENVILFIFTLIFNFWWSSKFQVNRLITYRLESIWNNFTLFWLIWWFCIFKGELSHLLICSIHQNLKLMLLFEVRVINRLIFVLNQLKLNHLKIFEYLNQLNIIWLDWYTRFFLFDFIWLDLKILYFYRRDQSEFLNQAKSIVKILWNCVNTPNWRF